MDYLAQLKSMNFYTDVVDSVNSLCHIEHVVPFFFDLCIHAKSLKHTLNLFIKFTRVSENIIMCVLISQSQPTNVLLSVNYHETPVACSVLAHHLSGDLIMTSSTRCSRSAT